MMNIIFICTLSLLVSVIIYTTTDNRIYIKTTKNYHVEKLSNFQDFSDESSLNELAHPRRIVLHDPRQTYLSHFNELQRSYQRLENYMKDADRPQEDIDKIKAKADEMFKHLRSSLLDKNQ